MAEKSLLPLGLNGAASDNINDLCGYSVHLPLRKTVLLECFELSHVLSGVDTLSQNQSELRLLVFCEKPNCAFDVSI